MQERPRCLESRKHGTVQAHEPPLVLACAAQADAAAHVCLEGKLRRNAGAPAGLRQSLEHSIPGRTPGGGRTGLLPGAASPPRSPVRWRPASRPPWLRGRVHPSHETARQTGGLSRCARREPPPRCRPAPWSKDIAQGTQEALRRNRPPRGAPGLIRVRTPCRKGHGPRRCLPGTTHEALR